MKRVLFVLLAISCLTVSAFADMGPKPQLIVRVENAPEELYYLDLLEEGELHSRPSGRDSLNWSYSDAQIAALDQDLLNALRSAVPDGWHACTSQGVDGAPMWGDLYPERYDENGDPLHVFGYHGVPSSYRIFMVTKDGESFLSGTMERQVLQGSVTVDWAEKTVSRPAVWFAYMMQFLCTFLPTLLVEGALLLLFRLGCSRRNRRIFLLLNLASQGALTAWFAYFAVHDGVNFIYYLLFIPAEIIIAAAETAIYETKLEGSKQRKILYGLTANCVSACLGYFLMTPVWQWVVSIS